MTVKELIVNLLDLPQNSRIDAVLENGTVVPITGIDPGYQDGHPRPVSLLLAGVPEWDRTLVELASAWGE